jgi:tetratricopeptide (TPR) repeat protein
VIPVLLFLGLLFLGLVATRWVSEPAPADDEPIRLALAPIEAIGGDPELGVLAAVLDEELKTNLTRLFPTRLDLVGRLSSSKIAADRDIVFDQPVDLLLEGKLGGESSSPRLFLHLYSIAQSKVAWSAEVSASLSSTVWFPELARGLAEVVGLSEEWSSDLDLGTSLPEAYKHYLSAMSSVRGNALQQAKVHLERALELDPEYLHALVLLGRIHLARGRHSATSSADGFERAEAAFRRALEVDPELPDAFLNLAMVQLYGLWDWHGAEESFMRARRYGPGRADIHHGYAWYLLASQRFEEAKSVMNRALQLDPLAPVLHSDLGWFHYRVRDFEGALTLCHAALELDPELQSALDCRHRALARLGRFDEALAHGVQLGDLPEQTRRDLLSRQPEEGYCEYLLWVNETWSSEGNHFVRAMNFAAAGRQDDAVDQLEKALERRESLLVLIDVTPEFDSIASRPRFHAIREQVKAVSPRSRP